MNTLLNLSNLKLCLEMLSRFQMPATFLQIQQFLADDNQAELLNEAAEQFKQRWENFFSSANLSELEDLTGFERNAVIESENLLQQLQGGFSNPPVRFKLPNAMVNKPYQARLEWFSDMAITIVEIAGLDNLGLRYDSEQNRVAGEPQIAGEHVIIIAYHYLTDPVQTIQTAHLNLVINSDPKSLWKDIPSDPAELFWKADSYYQGQIGHYGWQLLAASKRGRSHAHMGKCRDDDFALSLDNNNHWQVVAVTDGAGSSQYAREGARVIAHYSVDVLTRALQQDDDLLDDLILQWRSTQHSKDEILLKTALAAKLREALAECLASLDALAEQQQVSFQDFYSTLLVAGHKTFPSGEFIFAYWIGDGGLALYHAEQKIDLLGTGDSGEFAGQTRFLDASALQQDDIINRLQIRMPKNFTALVLMTDGISDPLFETDNNLRQLPCWDAFWQQIQPLLAQDPMVAAQHLTQWLSFWSPGNHDDRTLALIYR